jgi:tripeptidyl-peptidase-1
MFYQLGVDVDVARFLAQANDSPQQRAMYNSKGRAYPDITCTGGAPFYNIYYENWDIGGGTSVAAPTVASMIALLNDWRLRHHKPTLGFFNPFLYKHQRALVDMLDGNVNGCDMPGFNATKGWDPASGLGYFDFKKLQALL